MARMKISRADSHGQFFCAEKFIAGGRELRRGDEGGRGVRSCKVQGVEQGWTRPGERYF